jgi:tetrahydromethanopterin S-methyltransferase subunit G
MGIKIDKISVKELGPIKSFTGSFGIFNLIYSINERGKTFLTEFIIRSLFKNISRWSYLRTGGKGKISISGLEKKPIDFSPASSKKLEDYLTVSEKGFPVSFAKLLVVKGGEAGIEKGEGISKSFIKEVLSGINILDKIDSDTNISKTIKNAEVKGSMISIAKTGEGNKYLAKKSELDGIEKLFEEIESEYTQGIIKTCRIEEKILEDRLLQLDRAKKHQAYIISERIKDLDAELKNIPEDELNKLETDILLYSDKKESYRQLEEKYKKALKDSEDLEWLESALSHYRNISTETVKTPSKFLLSLGNIFAAAATIAAVLFFLNQRFFNIQQNIFLFSVFFFFLASIVSFLVYIRKIRIFSKQAGQSKELDEIKEVFNKRTGKRLTDIALLEATLNNQRESRSRSLAIEEQTGILNNDLKGLLLSINRKITAFTGKEAAEQDWYSVIARLKQNNKDLRYRIDNEKDEIRKLGIPETDYLSEEVEIKYDQQEYKDIQSRLEQIREEVENREDKIQKLKYRICEKTGDDLSIGWEELIENLRGKRQEVQNELREVTAGIVAGFSVHKIISELRLEEDAKIREGLKSQVVLDPLKDITKRYSSLVLDDGRLIVSDQYDDFDIKDLSTGAKEQVMLALRIGFTSKLLGKDALFLILDDAFQHSDWQKRKILIDKLADISKKGWQIIYLTMDDHIKELFDKTGKNLKDAKYKSFTL